MEPFDSFPDYAFYGGVRYESYGDRMRKSIGSTNLPWGIPKSPGEPTLTPNTGGNMAVGDYKVFCVGVTATGYKGMPYSNTPQSVTVVTDGKIDVSGMPVFSSPEIQYVALYRTPVGQEYPFAFAGWVRNGVDTITLNGSDDTLDMVDLLEPPDSLKDDEGSYAGPFRYAKPEVKKRCFAWDGRIFIYGEDEIRPGTIAATDDSEDMVVSGGMKSDFIGKTLVIDGEDVGYNIVAVPSETMVTVDPPYQRPHWKASDPSDAAFAIVGNPFELFFSETDNPNYFSYTNTVQVGKDEGGTIQAHAVYLDDALIFTESNIFILNRTGLTAAPYSPVKSLSKVGCTAPRSVVDAGNAVYFFSGEHFYVYSNGSSTRIDRPLGNARDYLNTDILANIKGCRFGNNILWAVSENSAKFFDTIYIFNTELGIWELPWKDLRFVDLETVYDYEGNQELWIECKAGEGYTLHKFNEDFYSDNTTSVYQGKVSSSSSTSLTDDSATFPTTIVPGLTGAKVEITFGTGLGQKRYIETYSSTTIQINKPWDIIPDDTSEYAIGLISWEAIGGKLTAGKPHNEKTFMNLEFGFNTERE